MPCRTPLLALQTTSGRQPSPKVSSDKRHFRRRRSSLGSGAREAQACSPLTPGGLAGQGCSPLPLQQSIPAQQQQQQQQQEESRGGACDSGSPGWPQALEARLESEAVHVPLPALPLPPYPIQGQQLNTNAVQQVRQTVQATPGGLPALPMLGSHSHIPGQCTRRAPVTVKPRHASHTFEVYEGL